MKKSAEVDNYISGFPEDVQAILEEIRAVVKLAAPEADEIMNYGIPTLTLEGNLVHFAGYKNHIGFYPAPSGIVAFQDELSVYKGAKGSVQFPIDQPLPMDLVTRIVKFRVDENLAKAALKKGKKRAPKVKLSDEELVTEHIQNLDNDLRENVETIRRIILGTDPEIGERIKWNNPSFYYTGDMLPFDPKEYKREIAVFNLHKGNLMLVFPSGAKVDDTSGLLTGDYADGRRIAVFKDSSDIRAKEHDLLSVLKRWLELVEK